MTMMSIAVNDDDFEDDSVHDDDGDNDEDGDDDDDGDDNDDDFEDDSVFDDDGDDDEQCSAVSGCNKLLRAPQYLLSIPANTPQWYNTMQYNTECMQYSIYKALQSTIYYNATLCVRRAIQTAIQSAIY